MRTELVLVGLVLLSFPPVSSAIPQSRNEDAIPIFRVTSAEVRVTFTATDAHRKNLALLSTDDLRVFQDGRMVPAIVSLQRREDAPFSAVVLTDVSGSMRPALNLERIASRFLRSRTLPGDQIKFLDFDRDLGSSHTEHAGDHQLTSIFDSLIKVLPDVPDAGRKAVILLTDGNDNYSYHSLNETIELAQRFDVAIYAITAHPRRGQYYRPDLLQELCTRTGGTYLQATSREAMLRAMGSVVEELRNNYELIFRPGTLKAGMHQIAIVCTKGEAHLHYRTAYFQTMEVATEFALAR